MENNRLEELKKKIDKMEAKLFELKVELREEMEREKKYEEERNKPENTYVKIYFGDICLNVPELRRFIEETKEMTNYEGRGYDSEYYKAICSKANKIVSERTKTAEEIRALTEELGHRKLPTEGTKEYEEAVEEANLRTLSHRHENMNCRLLDKWQYVDMMTLKEEFGIEFGIKL